MEEGKVKSVEVIIQELDTQKRELDDMKARVENVKELRAKAKGEKV